MPSTILNNMSAQRFDTEEVPVEVTEEHLLTETGHFKDSMLNMNQILDSDLSLNIFTMLKSEE